MGVTIVHLLIDEGVLRGSTRHLACTPGQKWPRCVASSLLLWLAILIAGTRHPAVAPLPGQHTHNHISFVTPSLHQSSLCSPFFPLVVWTNHADLSHSLSPLAATRPPPRRRPSATQSTWHERFFMHAHVSLCEEWVPISWNSVHECMHGRGCIYFPRLWSVCCLVCFCRVVAFHPSQPCSSPTHIASYGL